MNVGEGSSLKMTLEDAFKRLIECLGRRRVFGTSYTGAFRGPLSDDIHISTFSEILEGNELAVPQLSPITIVIA